MPLMAAPRTMFEKVWEAHEVGYDLLFIDLHLVHEVTSAQAFEGLRLAGRKVRRPDRTLATADHNVATGPGEPDELSKLQLDALTRNCEEFGVVLYALGHRRQGIVHVIGPELGVTQPGMTVVCGDSHTSTHGAFGALAFGIGTSEVEHVLATQTLPQRRPKTMLIDYRGELGVGCSAKDLILGTIGQIGTDGAAGHVVEYHGTAIRELSMEGRMTIANMSIEAGARAGMIAPDDTTFSYLEGRPGAPENFDAAVEEWRCWRPTRARFSTRWSRWTSPRSRRRSRGAPTPARWPRSPTACPSRRRGRSTRARVYGPDAGYAAAGDRHRPGVRGVVHQLADRGTARGGGDDQRPPGGRVGSRHGGSRISHS